MKELILSLIKIIVEIVFSAIAKKNGDCGECSDCSVQQ